MKNKLSVFTALLLASTASHAADLEIHVQNLTQGIYFTPLLISAHPEEMMLFRTGEHASAELQAMAEGGNIELLANQMGNGGANNLENPAGGLLEPGMMASGMLSNDEGNASLSLVGMLLPTNDGFVGLDSWPIPSEPGTYHIYLNGYDAGTEANNEARGSGMPGEAGFPVPPPLEALIGHGGTGVTTEESNQTVHIHRGNLGDSNATGGKSDIDSTVQRWLNPVAKVTVIVN
ncbi:spondin domain-containing protein [Bowmanella yangjiangensis]|uniref:Spondin domain-containing protein n=1 Tax=Bowmanella yangjiangensis TaxID=2811230 RepID=A0ABS3CXP9_9ALTE|nr:spondin domain-containing protein [Bowmanella yangjiangensis]MBN7821900.1 spondin domain-containing protein [Bowmanella yangjiangensis]